MVRLELFQTKNIIIFFRLLNILSIASLLLFLLFIIQDSCLNGNERRKKLEEMSERGCCKILKIKSLSPSKRK